MARLIDADKFCEIIDDKCLRLAKKLGYKSYKDASENMKWYLNGVSDSVGTVLDMTAVDAVEVVRCKDCKYFAGAWIDGYGECRNLEIESGANDYCSFAERGTVDGEND